MKNTDNFRSFLESVRMSLAATFRGCRIEETTGTKNNGIRLAGLAVRPQGSKVAPVVYMEQYFQEYREGRPFEDVFAEIAGTYKKAFEGKTVYIDPEKLNDFGFVSDKICFTLVNRELNRELLAAAPHRDFHGLSIVYYILLKDVAENLGTVTVSDDLMRIWGVDEALLYDIASNNTPVLNRGCVEPLMDEVCRIKGCGVPDGVRECFSYRDFDITIARGEDVMYMASTVSQTKGSSVILYRNFLEKMSEKLGSFFALPSTIHEFVIAPGRIEDAEAMSQLVKRVNSTCVAADDILSDGCFFYDMNSHELKEI